MLGKPEALQRLEAARDELAELEEPWSEEALETALQGVLERTEAKPGQVYQPIRVALAGTTVSPGIFETLRVLGKDETLRRIDLPSTVCPRLPIPLKAGSTDVSCL